MMRNRTRLRQGIYALVAAAAVVSAIAIVQAATNTYTNEYGGLARLKQAHIVGEVFEPRSAGPIGDPNFFAQVLLIAVPLPLMLGFRARSGWARIAWLTAAALIVATILLTFSRGAVLALGVIGLMLLGSLEKVVVLLHTLDRSDGIRIGLRSSGRPHSFDVYGEQLFNRPTFEVNDEFDTADIRTFGGEYAYRFAGDW